MDLVIFEFLVDHISKINRILKQPNGHGLLIGMEGMGRSSATKLAVICFDSQCFLKLKLYRLTLKFTVCF
jgi:dynein heavy chain